MQSRLFGLDPIDYWLFSCQKYQVFFNIKLSCRLLVLMISIVTYNISTSSSERCIQSYPQTTMLMLSPSDYWLLTSFMSNKSILWPQCMLSPIWQQSWSWYNPYCHSSQGWSEYHGPKSVVVSVAKLESIMNNLVSLVDQEPSLFDGTSSCNTLSTPCSCSLSQSPCCPPSPTPCPPPPCSGNSWAAWQWWVRPGGDHVSNILITVQLYHVLYTGHCVQLRLHHFLQQQPGHTFLSAAPGLL